MATDLAAHDPATRPERRQNAPITAILDEIGAAWRRSRLQRGIATLVAVVGGLLLAVMLWDLATALPPAVRLGGLIVAAIAAVWLTWRGLVRPLRESVTRMELAAAVEQRHPAFEERLITIADYAERRDGETADDPSELYFEEQLLRETREVAEQFSWDDAFSTTATRRWMSAAVVVGCVLLTVSLLPHINGGVLWGRMLAPTGNWDTAGNLSFAVETADDTVPRNSDVLLTATPQWRFGEATPLQDVELEWRTANDHGRRSMTGDGLEQRLRTTLKNVQRDFRYRIRDGAAVSRWYSIRVVDPPRLLATRAEITPASYTGEPSQRIEGRIGELPMVAGSHVAFTFEFSKPIVEARLELAPVGNPVLPAGTDAAGNPSETPAGAWSADLPDSGDSSVSIHGIAEQTAKLQLAVVDIDGLETDWDLPARIRLIDDAPPELALNAPDDGTPVRTDAIVPIEVIAEDDFAVAQLELHWELPTGETEVLTVPAAKLGRASAAHRFEVDLSQFSLPTGGSLFYTARAADNRPTPGPQETWSETRELVIEAEAAPVTANQLARERERMRQQLQQLQAHLERNAEELRDLHGDAVEEVLRNGEADTKEGFEQSLRDQAQLRNELQQALAEMSRHPLLEEIAQRQGAEIDEQLQSAMQSTEAVQSGAPRERIENLSRALDDLDGAGRGLQELLNQFDRMAALERDLQQLERLSRDAEALAENAERAAPSAENSSNPAGPQPSAADLQAQGEELSQQLREFLEQHSELIDAARDRLLDQLEAAAARAEQLADRQEALAAARENADRAEPAAPRNDGAPAPAGDETAATEQGAPAEDSPANSDTELSRLQQEQSRLRERLAEQTISAARASSAESVESTASQRGFEAATRAEQALSEGNLSRAAEQAQQAARAAQEAADRMNRNSAMSQQARQSAASLAADQQDLSERLQQAAGDPSARQAAAQQAQQQAESETGALADFVQQLAERLANDPIGEPQRGEQAQQAASQLSEARQSMQQAAASSSEEGAPSPQEASRAAQQQLRQAAETARQAAERENRSRIDAPRELSSNLVSACQCLSSGAQALAGGSPSDSSGNNPAPGDSSSSAQNAGGQPQDDPAANGQPRPGAGGEPSNQPSAMAEAARSFRQAAELLNQAMTRPASSPPSGQSGKNSLADSGKNPPGQSPNADPANAPGGNGTGTTQTLSEGELAELLKAAGERRWGELPPKIAEDIRDAANRRGHDDYSRLINAYFEAIADTEADEQE